MTQKYLLWLLASVFYAYQYVLRVLPNIFIDEITSTFGNSMISFGNFSGIYYVGYAIFHIPCGALFDKFGTKKVMPICVILTALGILPLLYTDSWLYGSIGRLMTGIGSSAAILGLFYVIRNNFDDSQFNKMLSLGVMIGLIGAIYGGAPLYQMSVIFSYKIIMKFLFLLAILLAVLFYFLTPDSVSKNSEVSLYKSILLITGNFKFLIFCILSGMMVGPLEGFADVWATKFLKEFYGYEDKIAASIPSLIFTGMCFGAPILSYFADKSGKHTKVITFCAILMFLIFTSFIYFKINIITLSILFILIGVLSSYQIISIYKASTLVPAESIGIATATANMIIMLFGFLFHGAIGFVVDKFGGINNPKAVAAGVSVIPSALFLVSIIFLLINFDSKKPNDNKI